MADHTKAENQIWSRVGWVLSKLFQYKSSIAIVAWMFVVVVARQKIVQMISQPSIRRLFRKCLNSCFVIMLGYLIASSVKKLAVAMKIPQASAPSAPLAQMSLHFISSVNVSTP